MSNISLSLMLSVVVTVVIGSPLNNPLGDPLSIAVTSMLFAVTWGTAYALMAGFDKYVTPRLSGNKGIAD
ncbi:hypothetical protein KEM60_01413 [Austwickia sp. TVS 96-490-7B]|uniref:hypothetical protein n=1 Tax=Austwickia sp. TVS 96-490-7B TaxID=2830843 RepID=UPI001C570859|nr:hypothetical protein [Austwickia sp. TVS 96-490-7B]MBW3085216.1 hypothetical protein [Austwickia sp. TVS 96-490-7B]